MKIVAIGVGGTGAACVETLVHLTTIGLLPEEWELVPVLLDPDQGHPRVTGVTNFIRDYCDLRQDAEATDLNNAGLFGTRIVREQGLNALKPAKFENLYMLLGLGRPDAEPIGALFFSQEEIGTPSSHEFANGFYGRANAGVCFFSDPEGKAGMLVALREHLRGGTTKVVVLGSIFGGTGAAGLLHVARTIREDEELRAEPPPVAVIHLESYFEPDASNVTGRNEFVNLPQTFQRRTGSAYQYLATLANDENLPFQVLYPLGVRSPTVFPPSWFKRDQQDNPHVFVEYLAALAVRDFILNTPAPAQAGRQKPEVRVRRAAHPPFGEPLDVLRRLFWASAVAYRLITNFVTPLLSEAGRRKTLPGHPWIHDITDASGLSPSELRTQFVRIANMLRVVLGHAGVLDAQWRTESLQDQPEKDRERYGRMTAMTRASFPEGFMPFLEQLSLPDVLSGADPMALFDEYQRQGVDAKLAGRALYRWVTQHVSPPMAETPTPAAIDYQLVQQESIPDAEGKVLNLAVIPDDRWVSKDPTDILRKLARATWKSIDTVPVRHPSEYPSIWAPAIVYRDRLLGGTRDDRARYQHLGMLWIALARTPDRERAPVAELSLSSPRLAAALRHAVEATCPLANYRDAVNQSGGVLVLHNPESALPFGHAPGRDEIWGYFFPDTVLVPSVGLRGVAAEKLYELGKYAELRGLPGFLKRRCFDWQGALSQAKVANAESRGAEWQEFLGSFGASTHEPLMADDTYERCPITTASSWVHRLYEGGNA